VNYQIIIPDAIRMVKYKPYAQALQTDLNGQSLTSLDEISKYFSPMPKTSTTGLQANPLIAPLKDNHFLIKLIADITDKSEKEVCNQFIREHHDLGISVREELAQAGVEPYVWSEELKQFYEKTNSFLYETLVWNRSPMKNDMRRWIGSYLSKLSSRPKKILAFGDGLGIDAYYLAELGYEVTYFDVSKKCSKFAHHLFTHGKIDVTMIDNPQSVGEEAYDAIICLDVLEHVPDPVSLVGWLASRLVTGGKLIVHAPFFVIHPGVQTHLKSNRRFSGHLKSLYGCNGLRVVDGQIFWNPLVLKKQNLANTVTSTPLPWRVLLGALLLGPARYCAFPHIAIANLLIKQDQSLEMIKDLQVAAEDSYTGRGL
jgi:2-polyprenyl-3-methyl-5-hydroxy-6-metoxy-1,4-benzoquinol methylase